MKTSFACVVMAAAAVLGAGSANADMVFDFNGTNGNYNYDDGFIVYAGNLLHEQVEGNGYLVIRDDPGSYLRLAVPLAPGIGRWDSWTQYLGGTLSFDVKILDNVELATPASFGQVSVVGLFGSGTVTASPVSGSVTAGGWTTYSIALTPEAGWGPALPNVLGNPAQVLINLELSNGDPRALIGIDNVRVTSAVPEASTGVMALVGLSLMGLAWRRSVARCH